MAVSKIQKPAFEPALRYVQTKLNGTSVAPAGQIAELTIPSNGTYLIFWAFAWNAVAWFNGELTVANDDYHVGAAQTFVRTCQANEKIWLKNGSGSSVAFYGTFTAIKIA